MKKLKQTKYITDNGKFRFFVDAEKKHRILPLIIVAAVLVLVASFVIAGISAGYRLKLTKVTIAHEQLPKSFDGFKILQISDILGREFGDRQSGIKKLIENEEYDIVVFTGDFLKSVTETDYWVIRDIVACIREGTPIYYVLGDNDYRPAAINKNSDKWKMCIVPEEKTALQLFLENECGAKFVYPIQKIESDEGEYIYLTGILYDKETMNAMDFDPDVDFSLTVTHKPINYDVSRRLKDVNKRTITEIDYDVSISGHTGGGQYRLPILGTIFDVDEGWFPQEDSVVGVRKDSSGRVNYISGGLQVASGFRFYSNPEISIIELKTADGTK